MKEGSKLKQRGKNDPANMDSCYNEKLSLNQNGGASEWDFDWDNNAASMLADKKYWPFWALLVFAINVAVIGHFINISTSADAVPPLTSYVSTSGEVIISEAKIHDGEKIFHMRGLMGYGTILGDGSERGPDYSAEALHMTGDSMKEFYRDRKGLETHEVEARVIQELHTNTFDEQKNVVVMNEAMIYAWKKVQKYYIRVYTEPDFVDLYPVERFQNVKHADDLAAFYFWMGWTCVTNRPGEDYSYTHNWPYDPSVGNTPTPEVMIWSLAAVLVLFVGIMVTLFVYGQFPEVEDEPQAPITTQDLECGIVRPTQHATFKFFILAMLAFVIQTLSGVACAIDFVRPGGFSACKYIPFTVFRSFHTVFQIYWFFVAWVGATIFFLPRFSAPPPGQKFLIELLFGGCLVVAIGGLIGIPLAQAGVIEGSTAYWFGTQGWEYMELGRFWQDILLAGFVLWIFILYRGVKPFLTKERMWSPPAWLFYGSMVMVAFLFFSLKVTPDKHFIIADFWRWMVVHMWVEVTFEVFTTVIVSFLLTEMGLVSRAQSERATYISVMLFFITATVGVGHNFYWIAKPTSVIAFGSAFSTTQVLPLMLLTLDAWKVMQQKHRAVFLRGAGKQKFVMEEVFLFICAINWWNIFGAGVLGSFVNMPIVNYYLHSTYITGCHAHGAMFGVKGNVALAAMLFCAQHLIPEKDWPTQLVKTAFWCLNGGMVMMMFMDLFPTGLYQIYIVIKYGFWYARGPEILHGPVFQFLAQCRAFGGHVFVWGGLLPLTFLVCSRWTKLSPVSDPKLMGEDVYRSSWQPKIKAN